MQRRSIRRALLLTLLLLAFALVFSTSAALGQQSEAAQPRARHKTSKARTRRAEEGRAAPQFEARTLEGKLFTNASLEGSVTLLQFWNTRCPRCLADQDAVDEIDRKFMNQGLIVIAIDQGDSEAAVSRYLREHPRTCRVAVDPKKTLAQRFGVRGYPYYVVIDRRGRIAAAEPGRAGEDGLLLLLASAGLREPGKTRQVVAVGQPGTSAQSGAGQAAGAAAGQAKTSGEAPAAAEANATPPPPTPPKVIDVMPETNAAPAKRLPRTVFVLTNGERIESDHYTLDADNVHLTADGRERTIPTSQLDVNATEAANRDRGIDLKIPTRGRSMYVGF